MKRTYKQTLEFAITKIQEENLNQNISKDSEVKIGDVDYYILFFALENYFKMVLTDLNDDKDKKEKESIEEIVKILFNEYEEEKHYWS